MLRKRYIAAMLALTLSAGAASAGEASQDLKRRMATLVASMFGFSPDGQELWITHSLDSLSEDRFTRSTQLMRAVGEQLAAERPDYARLEELGSQQALEAARLEKLGHDRLMDIAGRLSDEDRKILGRRMVSNADESLANGSSTSRPGL